MGRSDNTAYDMLLKFREHIHIIVIEVKYRSVSGRYPCHICEASSLRDKTFVSCGRRDTTFVLLERQVLRSENRHLTLWLGRAEPRWQVEFGFFVFPLPDWAPLLQLI